MTRSCYTCGVRPRMKRGAYCRPCASDYERIRRAANAEEINARRRATWGPDKALARRLWQYNITLEKYSELLSSQDGLCAICRQAAHLHIDHDHRCCPERLKSCGQCVRGLLCSTCNNGLGRFRDDPELLRRAADYVAVNWIEAIDRRAA